MSDNLEEQYEEYLNKWISGIKDEIQFWDDFMATKGGIWASSWDETIAYARPFRLENYLSLPKTKFIDVGSGPFSRCGIATEKTDLDFTAVDPLAPVYNQIKNKYKIDTKIHPQFAMVEKLSDKFAENEFDIVHMSNALDHSFNPLLGIYQMLYICKIGGKVILRHAENEAERENYEGFHQWNLSVKDGIFNIWRKDNIINVNEILKGLVDIEVDIEKEKHWECNRIIITKLKDVQIPQDALTHKYNEIIFTSLCHNILNGFYKEKSLCAQPKKKKFRLFKFGRK